MNKVILMGRLTRDPEVRYSQGENAIELEIGYDHVLSKVSFTLKKGERVAIIEAEQSVIGAMIMDREAITVTSEIISGDDFYSRQYGVVFDAMVELNDEGKPVWWRKL